MAQSLQSKRRDIRRLAESLVTTPTPTPDQRRSWVLELERQAPCHHKIARQHIAAVLAGETLPEPQPKPMKPAGVAVEIQIPAIDGATWVLERYNQRWVQFHTHPANGEVIKLFLPVEFSYREVIHTRAWEISKDGELESRVGGCRIVEM